jgi:hypothetical protein
MRKEQEYLSGLYSNGLHHSDHSQELKQIISAAHEITSGNHIDKLLDRAQYIHQNEILDNSQLSKALKSDRGILEVHKELGHVCHEHNMNLIDHHISKINDHETVHHDNHKFDCAIKYLEHWKHNADNHIVSKEHIDHRLEQAHEHQNERTHTMSLDL